MERAAQLKFFGRKGEGPAVLGAVLIALVTFIVYLPVLKAGYIWDDDTALTENPLIRSVAGLRDIWFSTKPYDYFPLTFTSFWLEWRLWGANPAGYHVVNVLLHIVGAILFWRVLARLRIPGAWLAATVFAVHPVAVASVAWVAERKNTLSLVFYLWSLLCYFRFDSESGNATNGSRASKWYGLSLFTFLLALLSKTSVVTLPCVLLLCLWWRRSRNAECGVRSAELIADLRRLAPFFAMAFVLGLVTVWFQSHRAMSGNLYQRDQLGIRLLGGSWAVWFYLWKALLPLNLSMIYPRWEIQFGSVAAYLPALLGLAAILIGWRFRRTWGGAFLCGLGGFAVTLLPVLGFFDMSFFVYSRVADHLQYLALLGVIAVVIGGLSAKLEGQSLAFVAAALVVSLGLLSWSRARAFRGQESLWRDTVQKNPAAWAAWNNLGMATKNPAEEYDCYVRALRLNPNYVDAHNNLGVVLYQQGRREAGVAHFFEAVRLQPGSAPAHNNLGGVLMDQGKFDDALSHLKSAIEINPNYVDAHNNLGLALLRLGQMAEAEAQFETVLRLNPGQVSAQYYLGNIAFAQDRFGDAVNRYQTVLNINPDHLEARHNLAMALLWSGQTNQAIVEFDAVLRLNPDFGPSQYQLGEISLEQGRKAEALRWFAAAVQSQPNAHEARHRLGMLLADTGNPREAIQHLQQAVGLKPEWVDALADLAWLLATQADAALRDGKLANELASRANQLTGGTNVAVLDTLAAAQAETGQFNKATRTAQLAVEFARASGNMNLARPIEARLRLYEAGRPFRGHPATNPR